MNLKTESERRAAADDTYPDPHPHLTTLTAPSTTSLMDMVSYGNPIFTTPSEQDIHPASSASHHHQATAHYYPHPHHPSDYATSDWQQTAVAAAAAAAAAAGGGATDSPTTDPNSITTAAPFYSFAPADRPDLASVQLYHHHHHHHHSFPGGTVAHGGDLYSPSSSASLWHVPQSLTAAEDSSVNVLGSAQRYLPGMTSGRTSGATSGSSSSSSASNSSTSNTTASGKPKRRRVQSMPQRKAANIRERRRMFHLNSAFDELRKRLPAFNYEKRLSRIETLRLAMTYIGFMKDVSLGEDPRKVKLRPGMASDAGSDLSHLDLESITSDDANHDDVES